MGASQQFSLRWNNYIHHITNAFDNLRSCEDLVDVTLVCDRKKIFAHKMLLSACSDYFRDVFKENPCKHPVIIFRNVKYEDLLAIIDFMYHGEVNVEQEQLTSFLTTAEMLAVQGLSVGPTPPKEELRKRKPIFLDSPPVAPASDRQNSTRRPPPVRSVSPSPTSQPRSPPRKRCPSPALKFQEPEKPIVKKRLTEPAKTEIAEKERVDLEALSEDDGMMDVSELDISRDAEGEEISNIKEEPISLPEEIDDKIQSLDRSDQAGTSANPEAADPQGKRNESAVETEEYLEEEEEEEQYAGNGSYETAYVMVDEDGRQYVVNEEGEDGVDQDEGTIILEEVREDDDGTQVTLMMDSEPEDEHEVELIFAENVNEQNEVMIGPAPTFQCDECLRTFKRQDSLLKHVKMHSGRTECPMCSSIFSRVGHLTRHIKQKHPEYPLVIRKGRPRREN